MQTIVGDGAAAQDIVFVTAGTPQDLTDAVPGPAG